MRLLGALEVCVADELRPVGGPRQRALVSVLALSAVSMVGLDELIDTLWDEAPPDRAAQMTDGVRQPRLYLVAYPVSPLSVNGAV